jgi:hypothetical protein
MEDEMFKNKKYSITILIVSILSFSLGGLFYRLFFSVPFHYWPTFTTVVYKGEYAYEQYKNANYKCAKESLLNYLAMLDKLKSLGWNNDKYMNIHEYYWETGKTYGRLAFLEEKNGNLKDRNNYFVESKNRFKMAGWNDYSEEHIRQFLKTIDAITTPGKTQFKNDTLIMQPVRETN